MKKIAMIFPSPFPNNTGDVANFSEIANQLVIEGNKVFLICPKNPDSKGKSHQFSPKVEIIRIPFVPPRLTEIKNELKLSHYLRLFFFLTIEIFTVFWTLISRRIGYVIIRHHILTIQLPLLLRILGTKSIADGELIIDYFKGKINSNIFRLVAFYEKRAIKLYTFFKVSTPNHQKALQQFGLPKERILIIPVSMNLNNIPQHKIQDIPEHTFGYFGAFEKWQGVDILLNGFELVLKNLPKAKLYLVGGTGSYADTIMEKLRGKFSSNVIFIPSVSREVLWKKFFGKFRIIIIPRPKLKNSFDTILPMKLVESFAAGKPVIVMDIPVMKEIPENTVVISPSSDPSSLAKTMETLSKNDEKMIEISKNALKYSTNFDIRDQVKKIINALDSNN